MNEASVAVIVFISKAWPEEEDSEIVYGVFEPGEKSAEYDTIDPEFNKSIKSDTAYVFKAYELFVGLDGDYVYPWDLPGVVTAPSGDRLVFAVAYTWGQQLEPDWALIITAQENPDLNPTPEP